MRKVCKRQGCQIEDKGFSWFSLCCGGRVTGIDMMLCVFYQNSSDSRVEREQYSEAGLSKDSC